MIKNASIAKGETIHEILNQKTSIWCHPGCYSTFTSKSRNTPSKRKASLPSVSERVLKSKVPQFSREDFKSKCFLCTNECKPKDPKNPTSWKKWSVCEKEYLNKNNTSFKDVLLNICDERQDDWTNFYIILPSIHCQYQAKLEEIIHRATYNPVWRL